MYDKDAPGARSGSLLERLRRHRIPYRDPLDELYGHRWGAGVIRTCHPTVSHVHKTSGSWERCTSRGKRPVDFRWNTQAILRYDRADPAEIEANLAGAAHWLWLRDLAREADAPQDGGAFGRLGGNIGWCPPERFVIVDIDTPGGPERYLKWLKELGEDLDAVPRQRTAKGMHIVREVDHVLWSKRASTVKAEIIPDLEVDLRVGGRAQVVVEPSVHSTGHRYKWEVALP